MNKNNPTILLLGGGYVLKQLAAELLPGTFVITSRSDESVANFCEKGWLGYKCDTEVDGSLKALLQRFSSIDTVVDSIPPNDVSSESSVQREAERRIAEMTDIKRAIYLSTTGVYGVNDGSWVNEETPCLAKHPRSRARIIYEEVYRRSFDNFCALRIPAIYGPGRGIGNALKEGRYSVIGDGKKWSNRIHVVDLAAAIKYILSLKSWPDTICVADNAPSFSIDIVNYYCETFKLPAAKVITPEDAIKFGHHTMLANQRVSSKLLTEQLKFKLIYPTFKDGAATEFISI